MLNLNERIKKYRENDPNELESLINDFDPLISKYGNKLKDEDGKQDMIVEFIKILNKMPIKNEKFIENKYVIAYIQTALKNNYIVLNKKRNKIKEREFYTDLSIEFNSYYDYNLDNCIIKDCLKKLSSIESDIIENIFIKGISVTDLAKEYKISRQTINQTKLRALNKLKSIFNTI
ncbi:sigma-70 family RNA polymerase sigma factor [Clostridium perfringens]|uniref:sigma-70 family RNA polymerase sigma factor n=1 Tax=Clostridium perfringens TaxID=1502 RepID=UPI002B1EC777|nr:sigma-70 family RNA polymerase sigma factor [Clostridium perfringens]MEA5268942.1 sigma-70 family RNA polymerase sigma factor [Clostridium perfringens]MEA5271557.1 sigma-70 family RNA polymerase sigma factor [Clostridium perfringens]MEA5342147.1 sigma-70 family RNA polymerase sigma factor [Clostridium perfringens]MEA5380632.1 sigma-70 family RNA polymerase sigma factor [Clostridium perfringens]